MYIICSLWLQVNFLLFKMTVTAKIQRNHINKSDHPSIHKN
jgi:hypothetical protein